jgi:chemotaxis family two-component system sensor kinase Cph1
MKDVYEFFSRLFEAEAWPPRWVCGKWTEFHGWLYICSDLAIWLAYFAIPFFLIKFVTQKRNVPLPSVFWLFGAFILLCGLTHLIDALMFWWPAYRLNGLVRFFTACVSWLTLFSLFKILPEAFAMRTSAEFQAELSERKKIEKKLSEYALELEQKNKDMEQFAYIASHDLKEPIRTVSNYVQIIKEEHSHQLNNEVNKYLNSIHRATIRMNLLVKTLLDFSELGRYKKLSYISLKAVIEDAVADLNTICEASQAVIKIGEMPSLFAYETEMRQLFQNLITNAIKFRKKDSPPEIEITCAREDEKWKFSVSDNGIGIDPMYFERIFNIFQRLHTDEEYEGSGIGLANCKKIVELHKGKIWVESAPGEGATFYFTLSDILPDLKP